MLSTINALEYYSNNGFPQFKDTARFSKIIREWFNVVNVRNPEHGRRKKDHTRYPICKDVRHDTLSYLIKVHEWLQHWHDVYGVNQGFSKETFNAIIQTTKCIPRLVDYLFDIKELDYVLLNKDLDGINSYVVQITSIQSCHYYKLKKYSNSFSSRHEFQQYQ